MAAAKVKIRNRWAYLAASVALGFRVGRLIFFGGLEATKRRLADVVMVALHKARDEAKV